MDTSSKSPAVPIAAIAVVLVGTTHAGNVGASARALKTMGLSDLRLAAPVCPVDATARPLAGHGVDVLERARRYSGLAEAVGDCELIFGLTARERRLGAPALTARDAAAEAVAAAAKGGRVAMVFGREHAGLTNGEAAHCHRLVHIPANPEYPALNLAAAVQVLAYELRLAAGEATPALGPAAAAEPAATARHVEGFHAELARIVAMSGYGDPGSDPRLDQRLRRLFGRVQLEHGEVNLLRGILGRLERRLCRADRRNP